MSVCDVYIRAERAQLADSEKEFACFAPENDVAKQSNPHQENQLRAAVYRRAFSSRRDYHRSYYARTLARRRKLARERQQRVRWSRWLIGELCGPAVDSTEVHTWLS